MGNHYDPHEEQRDADRLASIERGRNMQAAVAAMDPAELDERYRRTIKLFGKVEQSVIGRNALDCLDLIASNIADMFRAR